MKMISQNPKATTNLQTSCTCTMYKNPYYSGVKATAGLGTLALSDRVWADPQRCLSVQ